MAEEEIEAPLDESRRLPGGLAYPYGEAIPEEGGAIEVAERVLWLRLPLPMKLDHVNVYAFDDGPGWTVIDTGFMTDRTKAIWESLNVGLRNAKDVGWRYILHHQQNHPDYMEGMRAFGEKREPRWTVD